MEEKNELRTIYESNDRTAKACYGLLPTLDRYFRRHEIPLTGRILRRQSEPYKPEVGAGVIARSLVIVRGLIGIGKPDRAAFLAAPFAVLPESKRLPLSTAEFIERLWAHIGDILNLIAKNEPEKLKLKQYEFSGFLTSAEVVV